MKAKFYGVCQGCERRHKLPGDVLAKHGYELSHGFFNGVCFGAGHAPYEVSCSLIQACIESARKESAKLRASALEVLASAEVDADVAWHHVYHPELSSRSKGSVYLWQQVKLEVRQEFGREACYQLLPARSRYGRHHEGNALEAVRCYDRKAKVILDGAHGYASSLSHKADMAEAYAVRQERRIKAWEPRELQPVEAVAA